MPKSRYIHAFVLSLTLSLSACAADRNKTSKATAGFSDREFQKLLETVANGWNTNDAALAASAFAVDAVYSEPPDRQIYRGRQEIFSFFGGEDGRDGWISITWHHVSYNESTSVGAAEFTFEWPEGQVHGMVSIRVENGFIKNWREYFYESDFDWDRFTRLNRF